MAAPSQAACGFERRLKSQAPSLIESRCVVCGHLIVGSVINTLREDEAEHRKHCPGSPEECSADELQAKAETMAVLKREIDSARKEITRIQEHLNKT